MPKTAKREKKLEQRAEQFSLVLNEAKGESNSPPLSLKYIYDTLISEVKFIAIILHDRDVEENGILKTKHYHIVVTTTRTRLGTILNKFSNLLKVDKKQISIEKCISLRGAVRYLMHLDHPNKAQYNIFDIQTNNLQVINDSMIERFEEIQPVQLIQIVSESKDMKEIMLKIGLQNFQRYISTIKVIFDETHFNLHQ